MASRISHLPFLFLATTATHAAWLPQTSGSTASLRGLAVVNSRVAWASGTKGTVLRTDDAGQHWRASTIPNTESLDFRDIEAPTPTQAWLISSGPGEKSRVYRTVNAGTDWHLQFTNPDATGFFDAIAYFTKDSAILLGDPVEGRFVIYTTTDGENWVRRQGPDALPGEGAFAASGTCLIAHANGEAWFGTGGARVFHSTDYGVTWTASQTPVRHEGKAAGVFSLAFRDKHHGIAVGGDYAKPTESTANLALSVDGGKTWHEPQSRPGGYRSAVTYLTRKKLIATGTSGTDISDDAGQTWKAVDQTGYNSIAMHGRTVYSVGPNGRIAIWR